MSNPFDAFDAPVMDRPPVGAAPAGNPFDAFDAPTNIPTMRITPAPQAAPAPRDPNAYDYIPPAGTPEREAWDRQAPDPTPAPPITGYRANLAAETVNTGASLINVLSDPVANLVYKPLWTLGTAAYDALAPHLGYEKLSPETRADLLGENDPQIGTRLVDAVGRAMDAPPLSRVQPGTPGEALARTAYGGALGMAALGGGSGVVRNLVANPLIGAAGAVTGQTAANLAPDEYKAVAGLLGNAAGMGAVGGLGGLGANIVTPARVARRDIARAIQRDETTPAELQQKLNDTMTIRPGATVANVGGENVRGLVERVAQTPGAGRTIIVPTLTASQQGQMARATGDLRSLTGTSSTAIQAMDAAMAARSTAAKPLYDQALKFDPAGNPDVMTAWQAATSQGWGKAALGSGTLKRNLETETGAAFDPKAPPSMAVMDGWKRAMDDMASAQARAGKANAARLIGAARDRVVAAVDAPTANPAYAQARDAWAGPSRYMDAVETGGGIAKPGLSSEAFAAQFARLTVSEREAVRIGAVTALTAKMGGDPAKLADMTKYLRSPEMRAKVATIMPDAAAAENWTRALEYEISTSELTTRSLGGSATARRLAETGDANTIPGDLLREGLGMAITGKPGAAAVWRAAMQGGRMVRDTVRARSDKIVAEKLVGAQPPNGLLDFVGPNGVPQPVNPLLYLRAPDANQTRR